MLIIVSRTPYVKHLFNFTSPYVKHLLNVIFHTPEPDAAPAESWTLIIAECFGVEVLVHGSSTPNGLELTDFMVFGVSGDGILIGVTAVGV